MAKGIKVSTASLCKAKGKTRKTNEGARKKRTKPKKKEVSKNITVDESENEEVKECQLSSKQTNRWKPISSSTTRFVCDILDTNLLTSLSSAKPRSFEEAQMGLNTLKSKMTRALVKLRTPSTICSDYKSSVYTANKLREEIQRDSDQLSSLSEVIEEQERLVEEMEGELSELGQDENAELVMAPLEESIIIPGSQSSDQKQSQQDKQVDNTDILQLLSTLQRTNQPT